MSRTTRLAVALGINVGLVVLQVVTGLIAHSVGLISDAGHNLTDVAAMALSLLAARWALRPRSAERSFGNHRGTILAALVNSAALAAVTVVIVVIAIQHLIHPVAVEGGIVVVVAAVAMVANSGAAVALRDRTRDLNMRAALLHMVGDVLASFCVLVAGVIIMIAGNGPWDRADPAASLVVAALIVTEAFKLSKESIDVLLESTPPDVDLDALRRTILEVPGVGEVHDLHVWSLSSEYRALSAHLVLEGHPTLEQAQETGGVVRSEITGPFEIAHTTFELECERCVDADGNPCGMDELHAAFNGGSAHHH